MDSISAKPLLPPSLAPIPILELTPPSSQKKSSLSFHALTWNPFCKPFVFTFMHVMGGGTPSPSCQPSNVPPSFRAIPFFSLSSALFSTSRIHIPILIKNFHTLCAKHPWWRAPAERK